MQEGLRKGTGDDCEIRVSRPVAVVPPGDITRVKPVLGRAAVAREPVDEPEPVVPLGQAALEPVDRLNEPAPVPRLDAYLRAERTQQSLTGGDLREYVPLQTPRRR